MHTATYERDKSKSTNDAINNLKNNTRFSIIIIHRPFANTLVIMFENCFSPIFFSPFFLEFY